MLFNSYIFIFLFLPICFFGYFVLNRFKKYRLGEAFLLGMSLWFYGYFNILYLFLILGSVIFNYLIYLLIIKNSKNKFRKRALLVGLIINVGVLVYFKYMDFFIQNINTLFNKEFVLINLVLPLGISFFTFQQISFIIDTYRGEVKKYTLLDYACFVVFFPQLIAGPIVSHDELIPQFLDIEKKKINWDNIVKGIYIFIIGLSKKVLIADIFGRAVDTGYLDLSALNSTNAVIIILGYTFQIYFDFSGYCDMAIGLAKMLNIDLPINFNSPYKAYTIEEFWDRWHITLTRFFTKYVYIPLGGNRQGKIKEYINIMIVFLLSGFWHGANWTFIVWGALHGLFFIITRIFRKTFEKMHSAFSWLITFGFLNLSWIFFRANTIKDAINVLVVLAKMNFYRISGEMSKHFVIPVVHYIFEMFKLNTKYPYVEMALFFFMSIFIIFLNKNSYQRMCEFKPTVLSLLISIFLLTCCISTFSGVNIFLYFNM